MPPYASLSFPLTNPTRRALYVPRKKLPIDTLPGFEQKFHTSDSPPLVAGKLPSFALQDGLAFIGYAAQAIAQVLISAGTS